MEREEKRGHILAAAAEVFARRGFGEATVDEIAAAAGVGKGTIYLYFPGKRGLFLAMLAWKAAQAKTELERAVQEAPGAVAGLRAIIATHLQIARRYIILAAVSAKGLGPVDEGLQQAAMAFRRDYLAVIASHMERAMASGEFAPGDPFLTATALLGALNSVAVNLSLPGGGDAEAAALALERLFLAGLQGGLRG